MDSSAVMQLPVNAILPELCGLLRSATRVVLQAAPGAGKTTTVPIALLDEPWVADRQIWMLEPRRLAAEAAARRLAENIGDTAVGGRVGLVTRDHRKVGPQTRIQVITEGVLTQRLQRDPELADVACIIFDEFHERSLQADVGLALSREIQAALRDDLRILLMSATLDGESLALAIDGRLVACPGRSFPLEISHRAQTLEQALDGGLLRLCNEIAQGPGGSILVFLPGEWEIRRALRSLESARLPVFPLFARLSPAEQKDALDSRLRRIILATAVAETSLTIDGVETVIDCGWSRYPEFDPVAGYSRLVTRRVTQAQAIQRAGRAGRTGPGRAWRLWNSEELLPADLAPEIERVDLGRLVLELARWGSDELPWLQAPHPARLAQAQSLLQELGLLDGRRALTALGARIASWPLEPRWALLLSCAIGASADLAQAIIDLAAIFSAQQKLPREPMDPEELLARYQQGRLDRGLQRAVATGAKRLARLVEGQKVADSEPVHSLVEALVRSFPDRIAQARGDRGGFRLSGGGGARITSQHGMAHSPFLVVLDIDGGREGAIRRAYPLSEEQLESATSMLQTRVNRIEFDGDRDRVVAVQERCLGKLVLEASCVPVMDNDEQLRVLLEALGSEKIWRKLHKPHSFEQGCARAEMLRTFGHAIPACDDLSLRQELAGWLGPFLNGIDRLENIKAEHWMHALDYRLGSWKSELERLLPASVELNGKRFKLDYTVENGPVLSAPVQWFYGIKQGPRIHGGTSPVCLHLLNPAQRPLAVTRDLASFWANAWAEVRGQMRSRYPKHDWPEEPALAELPERFKRTL